MPPPPMMGGPGGGPGGPMPPGMQAMAPGTHGMPPPPGAMGGHGPPPGAGPVQGPNGVMYFPGPQHPLLHLANGGSNKPPSRLERLRRWKEKRKNRNFNKKIRYQSRKVCADNRPRIKGKFVKVGSTPDLGAMDLLGEDDGPTQAGPEGLSDVEEDSFDSDPPPPARSAGENRGASEGRRVVRRDVGAGPEQARVVIDSYRHGCFHTTFTDTLLELISPANLSHTLVGSSRAFSTRN